MRNALLTLVLLAALAGTLVFVLSTHVDVPAPAGLDDADAEVRELVDELTDEVEASPQDGLLWARLAAAYAVNGFLETARTCYERALELSPDDAQGWYCLAVILDQVGDQEGSVAALERAAGLQPPYAPVYWRLGSWHLDRGEAEAAEAAFRLALFIDAGNRAARLGLARALLAQEQAAAASEVLLQHLKEEPRDRYARFLLGNAYRALGETAKAKAELAVGTGEEPRWEDLWWAGIQHYRRGYAAVLKHATELAAAGHMEHAIAKQRWLLESHPNDVALLNNLALDLVAKDQADPAIELLQRAAGVDPDRVETHLNLASAYARAGKKGLAGRHVAHALELDPRSAKAHESKGVLLMGAGKRKQALRAFDEALERDPSLSQARLNKGLLLCEGKDYELGLMVLEELLRREPTADRRGPAHGPRVARGASSISAYECPVWVKSSNGRCQPT